MHYTVSLQKCSSYNQNEISMAVKKLLGNLGGISNFAKKGQKILLKPNIVKGMKP